MSEDLESAPALAPESEPAPKFPASVADLRAWFATHCRDSAVARDTPSYNRVSELVRQIETILLTLDQGA